MKWEAIDRQNREHFSSWLTDHASHLPCLDLSQPASRFFIPPVLLQRAEQGVGGLTDPEKLDTILQESTPDALSFFVVERRDQPVTNLADLDRYVQKIDTALNAYRRGQTSEMIPPSRPASVDILHYYYHDDVQSGLIKPTDYITHIVQIQRFVRPKYHQMHVAGYEDQLALRRIGIGKDFWQRVEEIAKLLKFRYLTADFNENNISFFVGVMGFQRLDQAPDSVIKVIYENYPALEDAEILAVKFLYEQDKKPTRK